MPGEGAPVGEGKRITLSSPIAHHHHHHNVFLVLSVWCFGVSSVYSFDLVYSLLFGHITVITITHVMRMAHMHHHSSWFLVCETIRERRRRHHRDHGWPQAADTPSSFFSERLLDKCIRFIHWFLVTSGATSFTRFIYLWRPAQRRVLRVFLCGHLFTWLFLETREPERILCNK